MALKEFQAESKRLMDLMINSIYTHKEIFLRELISNASDAIDKLYYRTLEDGATGLSREDFFIRIDADKEARTITISDNGVGMTQEELDANLGVIAKSGSLQFKTEKEQKEDVDIIGQFGVGFYSAFMVSSRVRVESRAFGADSAYCWESAGLEGYEIAPCDKAEHGTTVTLWLKEDTEDEKYTEFADQYRVRQLVKRYSDYIRYPIRMEMQKSRLKEGTGTEGKEPEYETYFETDTLNSMVPIWKKAKSEVSDEEMHAFYKEKFYDWQDPLRIIRTSTEGAATYSALLFIPKTPPMDYYTREFEKGLQLYASGVLIMEKCGDLLPDCFSFVKGLVDSQDLSLNISREMLQHDRQLKLIAGRLEKKIASELKSMLTNDREKYEEFWKSFGLQLKFGMYNDYGAKKDELKDLVLFTTSKEKKLATLQEYTDRIPADQPVIYYGCGETPERILSLPQAEAILEKGYEILCLTDNVDEFALRVLEKYNEKEFKNIASDDLDLENPEEKEKTQKLSEDHKDMLAAMKEALGDKVKEVKVSAKLKSHPVCISTDGMISTEMEKVLNAMPAQEKIKAQRVLELNPEHPLFTKLQGLYEADKDKLKLYAEILYDQALLIEGIALDNPADYVQKVCGIL
ncbi:molecular chaperone HtpG [Neglecta sp. X4]|uniref:molecular chaperone HtpG n=1 Tax=unclassified Neglectibacter TaxID=2632164 RepID=UPI00136ACBEE|nr:MULTISPECIES: molecular chaperone HtpG [unclassified Neglectibacter]NBI17002.1 molecular chaperone HtpG [Neglectibacter sp. 59]NBJ72414.1 molecular chaperone HtpG [Neglectibacter sp. X4]NCE80189.1 molecular chaperone HtpG [Neglectibacter sp. X58]